jgi:nitrogen fixation protein NifB
MNDLSNHPCFNGKVKDRYGRIHLPVAPACNMLCNFCNRKYDCVNESHPGVTSAVLTPQEALRYLADMVRSNPHITVAGLAGPGDPFANPDETMQTLRLVRREFPEMLLCVATNGLELGPHIEELAEIRVSHVTITVNAVDSEVGARVYAWMRSEKKIYRGEAAAALLWQRQENAIRKLKALGITVKINSILIPGINDHHIPRVAETAAKLGVDILNCMPMAPVPGSPFEAMPAPEVDLVAGTRQICAGFLPQMTHCARCRADAAGRISESSLRGASELKQWINRQRHHTADSRRPFVAAASYEGALVNQHLGEAERLMIYQQDPGREGGFELKEYRETPLRGSGDARWRELAGILHDCRALLVVSAGPRPKTMLSAQGLRIIEMEGLIEEGLAAAFSNGQVPAVLQRRFMGCSKAGSCRGSGMGCG